MATRIFLWVLFFIHGMCLSQNVDSLNAIYSQYYETTLLATNPSGQYVVLNHHNTFGKDEDELFDTKTGKSIKLDKHTNYQFVDNEYLFSKHKDHSRFQNVKTHQYNDIAGSYIPAIVAQTGQILFYSPSTKELILASKDGKVEWKASDIDAYQFDDANSRLIYTSGKQLMSKDLKNKESKTFAFDNEIQWMTSQGNSIYCAHITATQLELYTVKLSSSQLTKQLITSPEGFEFGKGLSTYFEIREDEHFLIPLYLKRKLSEKKNPELKITYSNKNSRDKLLNHHLGIYNMKEGRWDYQPDIKQNLPVYKFLNEKGDFIVFDESEDIVEEQYNVILDLNLHLDYGKSSYALPQKRTDDVNYLWDRVTEQFIFFDGTQWWCHHIKNGKEHELLPSDTNGWSSDKYCGLVYSPEDHPFKIKGRSAVMLSNQFDYFLVNLKTHQVERITKGEEGKIKYQLQIPKKDNPRSSWNVKNAEIDLEKEMTFKLFNEITYDSGFALYSHKNKKTTLYQQGHYREMFHYQNGMLLTSHFALEPFALTKFEKGKYKVVYQSLQEKKKDLRSSHYQIFQYTTKYGTANAALLFPFGYDKTKKYPMIVNIYEKHSHDLWFFLPPYLTTTIGFNYMHYLMNGYMVLLPDLQYEIGNVKNSVITSLEKSIDVARLLAPIDEKNIGVLGLSYGGYETGLAVTNSNYFKTGVAGVMISDIVAQALSNSELLPQPNYSRAENHQMRLKSNVFDDWGKYLENSPIFHMKKVNIPVLIWTGLKDKNIAPEQSKAFFLGMKRLQKKAVLLEYTNETHNVFRPENQLDLNLKISQWFDYHLKNKSPADWITPIL